MQLRDFPGAQSIPMEDADSHDSHLESRAAPTTDDASMSEFPSSLSWLYCVSLAISLYCMVIIGVLHKGLDEPNYLRIRKVTLKDIFVKIPLNFKMTMMIFFFFSHIESY